MEAVLSGRASAMLPVPADDERRTRLLTTSLRAGEDIDDDVAVVVSTSGTTGTPKGAMLTAAALTASADATHRRLGGPGRWLLAPARPPHRRPTGVGTQRDRGQRARRRVVTARRGRTARGGFGDGSRPTLCLTGGRTTGQGVGRPGRHRRLGRAGRGADRRRADAGACRRKGAGPWRFRWFGHTA